MLLLGRGIASGHLVASIEEGCTGTLQAVDRTYGTGPQYRGVKGVLSQFLLERFSITLLVKSL